MKDQKDKSRTPILAAGGIVLRNGPSPRFAVVQLRKMDAWGLPKGKLAAGEDAMTAARREVLEETGYRVTMHEFLGTLAYEASTRPKVVQFWRMEAIGNPVGDLMRDVRAVRWLALEDALKQLTHLREQVFLEQVGPIALTFAAQSARRARFSGPGAGNDLVPGVPLAPAGDVCLPAHAGEREIAEPTEQQARDFAARLLPTAVTLAPAEPSGHAARAQGAETAGKPPAEPPLEKKTLVKKTWGWFRDAAILHRLPVD